MSLTFRQLYDAKPAMFDQSASAWKEWADSTLEHAGYLNDNVGRHITQPHWDGLAAATARGTVGGVHANLSATAAGLRNVETVLIQAGKDFQETQQDLHEAVDKARAQHFHVDPDTGHVTVPASLQNEKNNTEAQRLNVRISAALYRAQRLDEGVARTLDSLAPDPRRRGGPPGGDGPGNGSGNGSGAGWNGGYGPGGAPPLKKPSGNVSEWIQQAMKVLAEHGVHLSANDASYIATIIQYESGGNPHAINLWDSNAAAGHPSKGLMQTIDSTFSAYAISRDGSPSVWDPVDNIVAGVNYAVHRYGSLSNVPGIRNMLHGSRYVGY